MHLEPGTELTRERVEMQILGTIAGLILIGGAAQAEVKPELFNADTVSSMQELCSADEATAEGKYAVGFCYGWIKGLGQFYEQLLADKRFDFKPVVCNTNNLTREEVRQTFVAWAQANPSASEKPALDGIFSAMKEKHPCK